MGRLSDCRTCNFRSKCLRNPKTEAIQVAFLDGGRIEKIETIICRFIYSKMAGTAEPVFGNIRNNLGLDRFALKSKTKVTTQWLLYCMIYNLVILVKYKNYRHNWHNKHHIREQKMGMKTNSILHTETMTKLLYN